MKFKDDASMISRITWNLLQNDDGITNTVFDKNRMLSMAWKILRPPFAGYHFKFCGDDPTLHPAFKDILRYILNTKRNVVATIKIRNIPFPNFFENFISYNYKSKLLFEIIYDANTDDLKSILTKIAQLTEKGYNVRVRIPIAPYNRFLEQLFSCLIEFRKQIPFDLSFASPVQLIKNSLDTAELEKTLRNQFGQAAIAGPEMKIDEIFKEAPVIKSFPALSKVYRCSAGSNVILEPDGTFYDAPCRRNLSPKPLWMAPKDALQDLLGIIDCQESTCPWLHECQLLSFENKDNAETWVTEAKLKSTFWQWLVGPLPDPLTFEPSIEDIVRMKLNNEGLQLESITNSKLVGRFADICKIYSFLDSQSRHIFLKAIIDQELPSYKVDKKDIIQQESYPHTVALILCTEDENEWKDIATPNVPKFYINPIKQKNVLEKFKAYLATSNHVNIMIYGSLDKELVDITWLGQIIYDYEPTIIMELRGAALVDLPLWLHNFMPKYQMNFILKNNNAIIFTARAVNILLTVSEELEEHRPLISILMILDDDQHNSIKSICLQTEHNFQICIADITSNGQYSAILASNPFLEKQNMKYITLSNMKRGEAYNILLDMAIGKYVLFMEAGDMLTPGVFEEVHHLTRQQKNLEIIQLFPSIYLSGVADIGIRDIGIYDYPCGFIYARDLLLRIKAHFADADHCLGFPFGLKTLLHAKSIYISPLIYYIRSKKNYKTDNLLKDFTNAFDTLYKFNVIHNYKNDYFASLLYNIWELNKTELLKQIHNNVNKNDLSQISNFSKSPLFILLILCDFIKTKYKPIQSELDIIDVGMDYHINYENLEIYDYSVKKNQMGGLDNVKPLISIILVNYNDSMNLKMSIQSILKQSYSNYELIIIDAGSTDDSVTLLGEYVQLYSHIKVYRSNQYIGNGYCYNFGLKNANGQYALLMECHIRYHPNFFEKIASIIQTSQDDIILYGNVDISEEFAVETQAYRNGYRLSRLETLCDFYKGKINTEPWSAVINIEFLLRNHIKLNDIVQTKDTEFIYNNILKANTIRILPDRDNDPSEYTNNNISYISHDSIISTFKYINYLEQSFLEWGDIFNVDLRSLINFHLEYNLLPQLDFYFKIYTPYNLINMLESNVFNSKYLLSEIFKHFACIETNIQNITEINQNGNFAHKSIVTVIVNNIHGITCLPCFLSLQRQFQSSIQILFLTNNIDEANHLTKILSPDNTWLKILPRAEMKRNFIHGSFLCFIDTSMALTHDIILDALTLFSNEEKINYLLCSRINKKEYKNINELVQGEIFYNSWIGNENYRKELRIYRMTNIPDYLNCGSEEEILLDIRNTLLNEKVLILNQHPFIDSIKLKSSLESYHLINYYLNKVMELITLRDLTNEIEIIDVLSQKISSIMKNNIVSLFYTINNMDDINDDILLTKSIEIIKNNSGLLDGLINTVYKECWVNNNPEIKLYFINNLSPKKSLISIILLITEQNIRDLANFLTNIDKSNNNIEIILICEANGNLFESLQPYINKGEIDKIFFPSHHSDYSTLLHGVLPYASGKFIYIKHSNHLRLHLNIAEFINKLNQHSTTDIFLLYNGFFNASNTYYDNNSIINLCLDTGNLDSFDFIILNDKSIQTMNLDELIALSIYKAQRALAPSIDMIEDRYVPMNNKNNFDSIVLILIAKAIKNRRPVHEAIVNKFIYCLIDHLNNIRNHQ